MTYAADANIIRIVFRRNMRLGQFDPSRFQALAVAAPRRIEHDEMVTFAGVGVETCVGDIEKTIDVRNR